MLANGVKTRQQANDRTERRGRQSASAWTTGVAGPRSLQCLVRLSFHLFQNLDDGLYAWPADFVEHVIRFSPA